MFTEGQSSFFVILSAEKNLNDKHKAASSVIKIPRTSEYQKSVGLSSSWIYSLKHIV
jgi:hypothetical protein